MRMRRFGPVAVPRYSCASLGCMNTVCPGQVSFIHVCCLHAIPSPITPWSFMIACSLAAYMNARIASNQASREPSTLAETKRPNRVHLRYGLAFRFQLLLTPPRGDAITFSYRQETYHLEKTFTSLTTHTLNRTRWLLRSRWTGVQAGKPARLKRNGVKSFYYRLLRHSQALGLG